MERNPNTPGLSSYLAACLLQGPVKVLFVFRAFNGPAPSGVALSLPPRCLWGVWGPPLLRSIPQSIEAWGWGLKCLSSRCWMTYDRIIFRHINCMSMRHVCMLINNTFTCIWCFKCSHFYSQARSVSSVVPPGHFTIFLYGACQLSTATWRLQAFNQGISSVVSRGQSKTRTGWKWCWC